jgi:large subunit ribosomal protein L4
MKKLALKSALSLRFKEGNLIVVDDLKLERAKTRELKDIMKNLGLGENKVLFVLPKKVEEYENVKISGRNIPGVKVIIADNPGTEKIVIDGLNVYDILNHDKLVLVQGTVQKIEEVLG